MDLPFDPVIPFLGIYPKEPKTLIQDNLSTPIFIAALFTIAKIWKQPMCPSVHECIKQLWEPWLVWLSGLSASLQTRGSLVWFPVRAPSWVSGQVPSGGAREAPPSDVILPLFVFPFPSVIKHTHTYTHTHNCGTFTEWNTYLVLKKKKSFTVCNSMELPQTTKNGTAFWPSDPTAGIIP